MQVFDFHVHPGYDFHGPARSNTNFIGPLKQNGITGCSGSFLSRACENRTTETYEELLPKYNQQAWQLHDLEPKFFVPGIHIHPEHLEMSVAEIKKHHDKGGILIGELVFYMMGWDYTHKNLPELFSYCRDLGMVVSIHPSFDFAPIERIMENVPGLKLVIAHLGGYGLYDRELALMRKYETVYCDISAHAYDFDGLIEGAVNRVGSERILYGSDYPGYDAKKFIDIVINASIHTADKENILTKNAVSLLNVSS